MIRIKWFLILGGILVAFSSGLYFVHYLVFQDSRQIVLSLIGDLAFVPLYVFITTLVLDQVIQRREKQEMFVKLNMVIGTFYSEIGLALMSRFQSVCEDPEGIMDTLSVKKEWGNREFDQCTSKIGKVSYHIRFDTVRFGEIGGFLGEKRKFLLDLLGNPNLLEHESFTDLLWAVFHLIEEFNLRGSLDSLSDQDSMHLNGDLKRIYDSLFMNWLKYMKHLKTSYPFLYDYALRANPFRRV